MIPADDNDAIAAGEDVANSCRDLVYSLWHQDEAGSEEFGDDGPRVIAYEHAADASYIQQCRLNV